MNYIIYTTRPIQYVGDGLRVAGCCIIVEDKVLLIRRGPQCNFAGEYEIPGGKIEAEETTQEAAIREAAEETGIDVRNSICIVKRLRERLLKDSLPRKQIDALRDVKVVATHALGRQSKWQ